MTSISRTAKRQRHTLDFLQQMNELDTLDGDTEMAARISSYELAFRMQSAAPEAVDLSKETAATKKLYFTTLTRLYCGSFGTLNFSNFSRSPGSHKRSSNASRVNDSSAALEALTPRPENV